MIQSQGIQLTAYLDNVLAPHHVKFQDSQAYFIVFWRNPPYKYVTCILKFRGSNYTNPGYGLSLVDTLWNAGSYRQPLEHEGNPMT